MHFFGHSEYENLKKISWVFVMIKIYIDYVRFFLSLIWYSSQRTHIKNK